MEHGVDSGVCPHALIKIVNILGESRRVHDTEIAVLGRVRGRFSDVVKARPDKLTRAELTVSVQPPCLVRKAPPAHNAVVQR